jgi:hypothetical protein
MNFKKNKYIIIKKAISKDLATFLYNYLLMKRQVHTTFMETRYISPFEDMFGIYNDPQAPNTYSHYGDIAMETLLLKVKPIMEKLTNLKLIENYSYTRIYKKGDILHKHKDRFSCEISTTLNLGGDKWPIYINPNCKEGNQMDNKYIPSKSKGIEVNLNPGDMLVYRGNQLEHWREEFKGEDCCQVFLHYTDINTKGSEENKYDNRKHLGLPGWFKKDGWCSWQN